MEKEKLLTVRASTQWMARLRLASELQGETISGFVRRAVAERIAVVEDSVELRPMAAVRPPDPPPVDPFRAVRRKPKLCRHGLTHCRVCHRST